MTNPIWMAALACLATAAALVPVMIPSCRERGYPLEGNILVGAAVIALGLCAPATLAPHWIEAMVALGVTAMIPIGVDAWLDRAPDGAEHQVQSLVGLDGGSSAAVLAASAAALAAATCAMSTALTISITS